MLHQLVTGNPMIPEPGLQHPLRQLIRLLSGVAVSVHSTHAAPATERSGSGTPCRARSAHFRKTQAQPPSSFGPLAVLALRGAEGIVVIPTYSPNPRWVNSLPRHQPHRTAPQGAHSSPPSTDRRRPQPPVPVALPVPPGRRILPSTSAGRATRAALQ
jgi:hypothetical protein